MASDVKATHLTASGSVFAGRARIKAIHYKCGTSPTLVLKNVDTNGAIQLTLTFADNTDDNIYIPDEESATKYSNTYDSENADVTVNASSDPANPSRSIANIVVKHNAAIPRSLSSQAIKNTSAFYAN